MQHELFCEKLKYYNFSESEMGWNHICQTVIREHLFLRITFNTNWHEIKFGVPQGSILGPLLYLLYIKDLPLSVSPKLVLYADDTSAISKVNSTNDIKLIFQRALTELQNWF